METRKEDCRRVDFRERSVFRLSGPSGIGQMNVRYPYTNSGKSLPLGPMSEVLRYIDNNQQAEAAKPDLKTAAQLDREEATYQNDPSLRKAVEDYSIRHAESYYKQLGYHVTQKGKPYDLLCVRGEEKLFVEVKSTLNSGSAILLTRNERNQTFVTPPGQAELLVVRDIKSSGPGILIGGTADIYPQWKPDEHSLSAYQYTCELDKKRRTLSFSVVG
jgi:Domain of unknown function (DUF3883)